MLKTTKFYFLILCVCFYFKTNAQYFVNIESGAVFTGLNDIRRGVDGTLLSLRNDLESPSSPFLRLRLGFLHNEKHYFSLLYAPLKLTATGSLNSDVLFDGINYKANLPLEAIYKFNSYRFTYNRRIINTDAFKLGLGLSAKIRDAGSSLRNENEFASDFNVGFVPLINIISTWQISKKFGFELFGDGLAASRGRAIDIAITTTYNFTKNLQANVGYRILDGGSDGKGSYNFVQFHFAVISLTYQFKKINTSY
ncbi:MULTISPECIES: hypothetical protein [unclassified Polaribacter]|uniref:hypothetical protein n=1 Tax=unclassified Polaribacter TaxID=196858 RepID=UPI0011BF5C29|nr:MULTISPECIES: hypothetical protein [unclassified Polaribacter]TXD51000.1 hypothetical protein ES043_13885 [Polaribacter sp. IC063]TXD57976.1 hypothetical protein ES044_13475 [Polaribacter sp. IC066]